MKTFLAAIGIVLVCTGVSSAALKDSGAVYRACANKTNGDLRLSDTCRTSERAVTWNEVGPAGPQGEAGPQGPQGPKGDTGPQGAAGVVSLQSLQGTPCTRHDGTTATVSVTVGSDDSIALSCGGGSAADWCASNTPTVGPHMTVSCDSTTHQLSYHCDPAWSDRNQDPADGCELNTPLAPILLHNTLNPDGSVVAVLAGLAELSAGAGGTWTVDVQPQCADAALAACPGGTPSSPLPAMTVDQTMHTGDAPRAVFSPLESQSLIQTQFRVRVKTPAPIPVTLAGAQCGVSFDTTPGTRPDVTLSFDDVVDTVNAPDGPTVPGALTLAGFESSDYTLSGGFACLIGSFPAAAFQAILTRALTPWATTRGQICGAPPEWFFQWCPAGVPTGP